MLARSHHVRSTGSETSSSVGGRTSVKTGTRITGRRCVGGRSVSLAGWVLSPSQETSKPPSRALAMTAAAGAAEAAAVAVGQGAGKGKGEGLVLFNTAGRRKERFRPMEKKRWGKFKN